MENDYLDNYKDAKARLSGIQDETAKTKLEFINGTDKLHYSIEEGSRLDWLGDKRGNEHAGLADELSQLKQLRQGLGCADEYIWKLREGVTNQKDILSRTD